MYTTKRMNRSRLCVLGRRCSVVGNASFVVGGWVSTMTVFTRVADVNEYLRSRGGVVSESTKVSVRVALRIGSLMAAEAGKTHVLAFLVDAENSLDGDECMCGDSVMVMRCLDYCDLVWVVFVVRAFVQRAVSENRSDDVLVTFVTEFEPVVDPETFAPKAEVIGHILFVPRAHWSVSAHLGHPTLHKLLVSGRFVEPVVYESFAAFVADRDEGILEDAVSNVGHVGLDTTLFL